MQSDKSALNQDNGDYFDSSGQNVRKGSGIEYIKTRSWRIIPKTNKNQTIGYLSNWDCKFKTFFSIDGERYPLKPIQVNTSKQSISFFCIPPVENKETEN